MVSNEKLQANKANAQHSTGPRTEEGKAASSMNAVRHGLTAKTLLLPGEDQAAYDKLAAGMLQDLKPFGTLESEMATRIIDISWRLQRASRFEVRILTPESPDYKAFSAMDQHANRLHRQFLDLSKEYRKVHEQNIRDRVAQFKQAEYINAADEILRRPDSLPKLGFDFTVQDLEHWMERRDAFQEARQVVNDYQLGKYEEVPDAEEAA